MGHKKILLFIAAALVAVIPALMIVPGFQFSIALCIAFASVLVLMYFLLRCCTPITLGLCKIIGILLAAGGIAAAVTVGFIIRAAYPGDIPPCEYVVVLGAGVRGTVPSLSLQERIRAAYDYLTANPKVYAVLSGGQGPGEDMTEAACMYRELTKMGIDGSRLLLEESSTSTMENLRFSLEIAEDHAGARPARIGIVSSEYHLFRAKLFAGELGVEGCGIPARTTWAALRVNYFLREIAAVWKYLIFGS